MGGAAVGLPTSNAFVTKCVNIIIRKNVPFLEIADPRSTTLHFYFRQRVLDKDFSDGVYVYHRQRNLEFVFTPRMCKNHVLFMFCPRCLI